MNGVYNMTIIVGKSANTDFSPRFSSGSQEIAVGSTGNLLLATPPTGQRVRLVFLQARSNIDQDNITIEVGGVDAVTNKTLANAYYGPVGTFCVGHPVGNGTGAPKIGSAGAIPAITGKTDEAIRVYRTTGVATTIEIYYSYQFGI